MSETSDFMSQEDERLAALTRYRILDTSRESGFNELTELAAEICGTPIAVVNLIASGRQWFKAEVGLGVDSTPLDTSFCGTAILQEDFLLVPDATKDERFACNPLVTADRGLRFYAGALLKSPDGFAIGTLCVLDYEPRALSGAQQRALRILARQVVAQMELRLALLEREETNDALGASGAQFQAAVEAVQGVLWTNTPAGEMKGEQVGWANLTGQTPVEYQGYGWASAVHPEDALATLEAWNAAVAEKRTFVFEHRVRRRDGAWRRFSIRAIPTFDGNGEIREWVGVHTDVTERRAAEDQLRDLNEQLEARVAAALAEKRLLAELVERTDAFVQVVDSEFRLLAVNKASADEFERMYGVRPAVGASLLELLDDKPDHRTRVQDTWARALAGEEFTETAEFGGPGRDRRFYEMKFNALLAADGSQVGAYQFVYDVTERSLEQAALAEAQDALRQSQKMDAMGQLTGGVAHDFNNLLTPIVGALDMLRRKGLGGEREQRLISGAMQSAERAKTLVQRLLAFARRQPLQPTPVDVGKLVSGMSDLIASTTGPQVRVVVEIADELPPALADTNQLEMALLNLGVNARDAMPEGGTLRISAAPETIGTSHRSGVCAGDYIRLSVADTGAGMDEVTVGRAVEPFFSTKGVGKGTGLGLSMVHGLTQQLGGGMTIQSKQGLGTNIELWLPATVAPLGEVVGIPSVAATSDTVGTALLVDDEELVRISTSAMLSDLGYSVVEAPSAEHALSLMREGFRPDLVVTDHLMPGMSGTELARELQTQEPKIKVLIVSGYADAEGISSDLPRLTKPFRNDELAASLAALAGSCAPTSR